MFEKVIQFSVVHWMYVSAFLLTIIALILVEKKRGGPQLSTGELTQWVNRKDAKIVDIRDAKSFNEGHIVDAHNIALAQLNSRMAELNKYKHQPIVVVCKHGQHSSIAAKMLMKEGFENVARLHGGMLTWESDGLPIVK